MEVVDKRGNKNKKKEQGSEDGNNSEEEIERCTTEFSSDDSYDKQVMIEMEAAEKWQRKQDKIFYQEEILKLEKRS